MSGHGEKLRPRGARGVLPSGVSRHVTRLADGSRRERYRVRVQWQGVQVSAGLYDTLTDAKAALARCRFEVAAGTFTPPRVARERARAERERSRVEGVSVEQWAGQWLECLEDGRTRDGRRRSPATLATYRSVLRAHILPVFGGVRLSDLTPELVAEGVEGLGLSRGAYNSVVGTLRALCGEAVRQGIGGLEVSPVRLPMRRAPIVKTGRSLEPEQVAALAGAMPERLRLAVLLATWCALRRGEVLGLQRGDFEHLDTPERAVVHVLRQWNALARPPAFTLPKEEKTRTVAIPAALVPVIVEHLDTYTAKGPGALVFPSDSRPGAPISPGALNKQWTTARARVGVDGFRFHDLRAVGLSFFAEAGATVEETMLRGGHSDVQVAQRYQRARVVRQHALAAALPVVV